MGWGLFSQQVLSQAALGAEELATDGAALGQRDAMACVSLASTGNCHPFCPVLAMWGPPLQPRPSRTGGRVLGKGAWLPRKPAQGASISAATMRWLAFQVLRRGWAWGLGQLWTRAALSRGGLTLHWPASLPSSPHSTQTCPWMASSPRLSSRPSCPHPPRVL